jgi:hypothetical protein
LRALSTENQRLGEAVHTLGERMTEAEAMMQGLRVTSSEAETALQRLRATASETSAKIDRLERGTTIARAATPPSVREARHPGLERPDPTPGAPRRSMPVTDVFTPVLRPAAVSTPAPRPVMLPPADASPSVIVPEPQATTTPDVRPDPPAPASSPRTAAVVEPAPPARPQVVAERAASVAVSARAPESGGVDSASRGVTRLGDIFARGVLNLGKSIRRFVEDLQ